ncbi:Conserved_hypothetical protein [Hexamita inflata]|uniref:Uncharacterized protein n=1 Tax=Hexamita inflata TaxID=28002 RepID=A0AA86UIN3_9EUKA|nr:Conserved hypothetical protein [Hexamita inflata]
MNIDELNIFNTVISQDHPFSQTTQQQKHQTQTQIVQQLKSQIYYNLSNAKSSLLNNFGQRQSITKQDIKLLIKGIQLPQIDEKYLQLLPYVLENQFLTRFYHNNFKYQYKFELSDLSLIQIRNQQITNIAALTEQNFRNRYLDSVRIVTNYTPDNLNLEQQTVLLLLDFYQHPLTVVHFIQFLTKYKYKVICPYLPDIVNKSAMLDPNQSFKCILFILNEIEKLLISSSFCIVAQGSSAPIGLQIQKQYGHQCQKVILCNPILNFQNSQNNELSESQYHSNQRLYHKSHSTEQNNELTSEFSIENTNKSLLQNIQSAQIDKSAIESVQMQPSQYHIKQCQKPRQLSTNSLLMDNVNPNNLENVEIQTHLTQLTMDTPLNTIKLTDALASAQYLQDDQIISLHQELQVFYKDVQLLSGLVKAHDVSRLSDLELITDVNRFFKINSLLTPVSFMFKSFLRLLYSVFVFSPLEQIEQYHIYKSVFDRHFFESFAEMKIMLETNKTQWTDDMNLYCLVSSHGCFNSEEHLKKMNESRANFNKTQCRTIVGAGHDLFSVAGTVIEKLLR